jgi:hypothetical protein
MQSYLSEKLGQAIYFSMFADEVSCWGTLGRILWALQNEKREFTDPDMIRWIANIKRILQGRAPSSLDDDERHDLRTAIWELYNRLGTDDV